MTTEEKARQFLISIKKGFHEITPKLKRKIADKYKIGINTFDLIKLPSQITISPLKEEDLSKRLFEQFILIEIKSSERNDISKNLKGFFFGYTYSEQMTAQKLKNRYKIAFVVISKNGKEKFYKLIDSKKLWSIIKNANLVWHMSI